LNPQTGEPDQDYGIRFLQQSLSFLSPTLGQRWHYRGVDEGSHGIDAEAFAEIVAGADALINVSGGSMLRDAYRRCPRKVLIDTDPGWNHFVIYPRWDGKPEAHRRMGYRAHDHYFTYAGRLGRPDCPLPDLGLPWKPTRPPVVLDVWKPEPPGEKWTTVMMWKNYDKPVVQGGTAYGAKEMEFERIERLPLRSSQAFEVAANGDPPVDRWRKLGWSVMNGNAKSYSPEAYRAYVQGSRGEFSVAKNIYVATRSGWFSCRTACYLAAGRPAVVQDTGFAGQIPTGEGLIAFGDLDEAVEAVAAVEADYRRHARAARELAEREFDSRKVLTDLLNEIGLG
jgi:hypothetical protein